MRKYSVVVCVIFAFAACHLRGVDTTPVPPPWINEVDDSRSQEDLQPKKISLPKNKIRTKRGIPCPRVEDPEHDWEINQPCGCDPCDAIRNANEARMLRKQHRKIVAEMKLNRLKRKLHTAVCPSCALAHERELEHQPCHKPHVDITVVVPGANQHGINEVPAPIVEYPSLPPHRQTYSQVMQTGSQVFTSDPLYEKPMVPDFGPMVPDFGPMVSDFEPMVSDFEPMVPEPQYEPMVPRPQYGQMVPGGPFQPMVLEPQHFEGFGPAYPGMRSSVPDTAEKKIPAEDERDTKRIQKAEVLITIFVENENKTTTEAPIDSEEAWPWKNATYYGEEKPQHQLPFPTYVTTEAPPYDSGEAVPFNYTGSLRVHSPEEAVPINYTRSPRPYYREEAVPINYTRSPRAYDQEEAVPINDTRSPRPYYREEAVPIKYTRSPRAYDQEEAVPINDTKSPRAYYREEAVPFNYTRSPRGYDPEEAVPINFTEPARAGKYSRDDETSLRAPPTDKVLRQMAYSAASKAVASALNKSRSLDSLKSSDSFAVRRNCAGSRCTKLCLGNECLENEVRQKRDTSSGMSVASALLTGLVSAIIGA